MRIRDWSSDVCSSDLCRRGLEVDPLGTPARKLGRVLRDLPVFVEREIKPAVRGGRIGEELHRSFLRPTRQSLPSVTVRCHGEVPDADRGKDGRVLLAFFGVL